MRKIVKRYRFSKYRYFTNGLMFALIACAALLLCFSGIYKYPYSKAEVLLPFMVAIISLVLGFVTMFRQKEVTKGKA